MTTGTTIQPERAADAVPVLPHWVAGGEYEGTGGRSAEVTDPATGTITARLSLAAPADVDAAVAAAKAAFPAWRDTSLARRARVLFRFRELLDARAGELAELITAEHGKVLSDARGEVARGQEVVEFACGIPHLRQGRVHRERLDAGRRGLDPAAAGRPVAIISPFNFPAMVPMWFFPIAIAAGNTVVLKPSEKVPSAALWMARLWAEAGLPDGVFNVLNGDKVAVDGLLTHPDVKSVSFVGSTPIARYVYETATAYGKRVQALGGAKNHMVVLPDADLDLAADQAINAGFGSAGERCMAISAVARGRVDRRRAGGPDRQARASDCAPATDAAAATWVRWSPLPPGPGRRVHRRGVAAGRDPGRGRPPGQAGLRRRGLLRRPHPVRPRRPPTCPSTPTRSSARCCPWSGSTPTTRRSS